MMTIASLPLPRRYLIGFDPRDLPHHFTDVLVIGGGLAGLRAALGFDEPTRVLVVTKDEVRESNSSYAQGGIAAVLDPTTSSTTTSPTPWPPARGSATRRSSRWSSARPPGGSTS